MAHGIAHHWWTIFGSRDRETSLLHSRDGYVLPDLRVRFDGTAFEIEARQHAYRNPDVRFWGGACEIMSRAEGEAVLADLMDMVLERLSAVGPGDTSAALRWKRVQMSRQAPEADFCEAAGGLGLDPYQIDNEPAMFIEQAERIFQRETLMEFVSGAAKVKQAELLDWVERMRRHRGSTYRLADLRPLVDEGERKAPARTGERAWALGYRRARAMRRILDLPQTSRFKSFGELATRLGAGRGYSPAPKVDGIRALRSERTDGIRIHLRNQGDSAEAQAAHLFSIARAVGDAACFPEVQIAPINDLHNAVRQAAGRAFAAELLAPIDEIRSMLKDRHDLTTIADEFSVSTTVIERQIDNEARIDQACL